MEVEVHKMRWKVHDGDWVVVRKECRVCDGDWMEVYMRWKVYLDDRVWWMVRTGTEEEEIRGMN